jgi:hypothetical protein
MEKTQLSIDWFKMHVLYRNFLLKHGAHREIVKKIFGKFTSDKSVLSNVQIIFFLLQENINLEVIFKSRIPNPESRIPNPET